MHTFFGISLNITRFSSFPLGMRLATRPQFVDSLANGGTTAGKGSHLSSCGPSMMWCGHADNQSDEVVSPLRVDPRRGAWLD